MESLSQIIGEKTIGVIGVGRWGQHLVRSVKPHTVHPVLQSDPLRAAMESHFPHMPLREIAKKADIIFIATPRTAIPEILESLRDHLRQNQIIIDIASSKRNFMHLLEEIDATGIAIVGSIHPMAEAPPNLPSLRGQNGIVCTISSRSKEAEALGVAFFADQQMMVHTIPLKEHDQLMNQIQGRPHFFLAGACLAMSDHVKSTTMSKLEQIGSPNSQLFLTSIARSTILDAHLQADLITSMASSPDGIRDLEQSIVGLQKILEIAKSDASLPACKQKLPGFLEHMRNRLDSTGEWREHMREQTDAIITRLANARVRSLDVQHENTNKCTE